MPATKTCISKRNTVFAVASLLWILVMAHAGPPAIMLQIESSSSRAADRGRAQPGAPPSTKHCLVGSA
jgi:hypothetical protein